MNSFSYDPDLGKLQDGFMYKSTKDVMAKLIDPSERGRKKNEKGKEIHRERQQIIF